MKVLISVIRKTQYSSIVEMDESTFKRIGKGLDAPSRVERESAEAEANRRIDTKDWQDDELYSVDQFEPFKE